MRLGPAFTRLAAVACAVGWSVACERAGLEAMRAEARPDVLVITVDTLRADRLGVYGYPLETTPTLDRLAARGVRFADCTVQWPKTSPSMASFLSGRYPLSTGMRVHMRRLPDSLRLLPEVFRDAGYATGAVVANFNVGRTLGFDRGFEHFVESWSEDLGEERPAPEFFGRPGIVKRFTDAVRVNAQALDWLESVPADEPFFAWIHYMDPHGPYVPPPQYAELFQGAHPPDPVLAGKLRRYQLQFLPGTRVAISDLGFYKAQYDREVRFVDDQIGALVAAVESLGRERELLIAFSADHGESLGEHAYYLEHGKLSYQPTARVPALLVQDGRLPAGRNIEAPIALLDLSATLVELAGLAIPDAFEGTSLVALIEGDEAAAPPFVFLESGTDPKASQQSVRSGRWKLIHGTPREHRPDGSVGPELYDLLVDPGELDDVAPQHPEVVARLDEALARWREAHAPSQAPGAVIAEEQLAPADRRMLEALGYIDGDGAQPDGAPPGVGPNEGPD